MVGDLAFEGGLQDSLGQLAQQAGWVSTPSVSGAAGLSFAMSSSTTVGTASIIGAPFRGAYTVCHTGPVSLRPTLEGHFSAVVD
ncbi:hypothetical protein, partial [Catellatospora citrea]|uniref:hypothetical protein n=1 Tax=Catellatospora citrea TaxID=53366 RepID=UPI0019421667